MSIAAGSGQIPLVLKLIVTLWVAVLIPHYWRTTPLSFFWFCDAALLLSTLGLAREPFADQHGSGGKFLVDAPLGRLVHLILLWGVRRLGYDRRAVWAQTGFAWLLLLLSYGLTSDPHGPAGNLNMVYGLSPTEAQSWMSPGLWLLLVMVFCPVCWYLPTHLVLRRLFRMPHARPVSTRHAP